ncbi:MAG: site-specific DNA-methyltransferase [Methylococcales bacterium]
MADNYDDYSKEELIRELRAKNQKPRFGLYWERDDIEHERAINDDFVALDLDESLSCGDAPFQNLIIEGDNFDALRYLRMTYKGKVKCIYIDPPYNTGNKDFVYNDRFIDKDDVYKHSKWLEFMYRRLAVARDLLAEDGVIFVSIDDNEQANLKLLMDNVFGSINFIANFVWQKAYSPRMDSKTVSNDHDHILAYSNTQDFSLNRIAFEQNNSSFSKFDEHKQAYYRRRQWRKEGSGARREDRPNLFYEIKSPDNTPIFPIRPDGSEGRWRGSSDYFNSLVTGGVIEWIKQNDCWQIYVKQYLDTQATKPASTWLSSSDFSHNHEAAEEIKAILQANAFSTPKPTTLIKHFLNIATRKDSIVLDFFAGSGTTAHAVLKFNAEDGGNRRFILVSNTEATESEPDKNLCRDVCAERVRRVMQGYTNQKAEQVEGLGVNPSTGLRTGFAYLKTRRINSETLLTEIQHSQIWTALQLSHGAALSAFNPHSSVQQLQTADNTVMYLCQLTEQELTAVTECLEKQQTTVYSWQPALLSHYIENANLTCLPIPKFLLDRFATGVKA